MAKLNWHGVPLLSPEAEERNIEAVRAMGLPYAANTMRSGNLAIIAGGPSINRHAAEIVSWPGDRWAVNGAFGWCKERGIRATYFSVDPEPSDSRFVEPGDPVIMATRVDPGIVAGLRHADLSVFENSVSGPTSATSAPFLGLLMGYEHLTFFGCEGSFDQATHAYMDTPPADLIRVESDGETFLTKPEFVMQSTYLGELIRQMPEQFSERSGGLLSKFAAGHDYDVLAVSPHIVKALGDGDKHLQRA